MLLTLEKVCKSYGANAVLTDITARIEENARIGLVGVNGAGKTTLLGLITGGLVADEGTISRSAASVGYLRQNGGLMSGNTVWEEMLSVFAPLLAMEDEMRTLEREIAQTGGEEAQAALVARYGALQALFEQREGYNINVKINTVLNGMGFLALPRDTQVDTLSGGEKTRLSICKLLLEAPDLLILDEPTNHLDFKTLTWLEEYLLSYKGALLVVSHDRYFLDRLCSAIWDIEQKRLTAYNGNYSRYVLQKEERYVRQLKEYEIQQDEIAHLKDFVARNLVRASTTARAQSKRKTLEKMELIEKPRPPAPPAKIRFTFKREPVKDVLHVEKLSLTVGEGEGRKKLFENLDFDLLRGDKIAMIGPNGVGKSSFLKSAMGKLSPSDGFIEWGKNTELSYFEQEDFALDSNETALNELWNRFPREYEHRIRTVLGNVGLTGENVSKRVGDLSGGERAKLKFAILILCCGNVLFMDEPTNHLDLASKEALDAALRDYKGTLLVVSHDRYLLNQFPTKIAEMNGNGITLYPGNYDAYLEQKKAREPAPQTVQAVKEPPKENEYYRSKRQRSEEQARIRRAQELEKQILDLETAIFRLENEMTNDSTASDYVKLRETCEKIEQHRAELDARLSEWAEIQEP